MNATPDSPASATETSRPQDTDIPAIPPGVRCVTLENGLTLIIKEDHSAPVVSVQAWCKAGSINEGRWLGGGLSHVLEHMLFKGTTTRGAGRIDQEIQDAGGYMNAYTSFDRTVYWINVPNTGATVAIDILCDIVQHAQLPEDEMVKEKQVILREMDMTHDDPGQRSARRLFETAYTRSPYRFPIIGYQDIYNEVSRADVLAYYHEKYAPNNLFFVVVGDFEAQAVETQIREAFSEAKARSVPPTVQLQEPRQIAPRTTVEEAPIELGHLHFCWHVPELRHPDMPLIDILSTLLGGGRSSRLYQQVREKKGLVNGIDAWTYSPGSVGLLGMSAVVDGDKFEAACEAMLEEIRNLQESEVHPDELAKVVKQFTAATLASHKTMQGQAQDLGSNWMSASDLNFSARYLEAVRRATPKDLQRVARTYLTPENRTLFALLPKGCKPDSVTQAKVVEELPVQRFELENGIRLLVREEHRLPFVEMRALFKGGVLSETQETNGATLLMSKMLMQGTTHRSAREIATEIESVGGHVDSYSANNSLGITVEVLREDIDTGLGLLSDLLLNPTFPAEALEREQQIQLAGIRSQNDELLPSAFRLMRRGFFGKTGYGMQAMGTEASVSALTEDTLRQVHETLIRPNNCVLAIFGDVDTEDIRRQVTDSLASWKPGSPVLEAPKAAPLPVQFEKLQETRDKKQAVVVMGFPGCSIMNEDRYALELIQEACSDLGSRLFMRIRDELGLAYYVGAQSMLGLVPGYFAFYVGTAPDKVEQVEEELFREAGHFRDKGLTAEELNRAKAKIIGQRKIARQDLGHHAINTALDELYGLGYQHQEKEDERYAAVTHEDIVRVAQKHLVRESCVLSILGPGS